jgi:hypothetical protein
VSTNITTVVTTATVNDTQVYANCASGFVALGGGSSEAAETTPHNVINAPTVGAATSSGAAATVTSGATPKGWTAEYRDGSDAVTVYVICSK